MENIGYRLGYDFTKDTLYLTLMGKVWSLSCCYFGEKILCYKEFRLYWSDQMIMYIRRLSIYRPAWVNMN